MRAVALLAGVGAAAAGSTSRCLANMTKSPDQLGYAISIVCGQVDCAPINEGGAFFWPNNIYAHSNWAFNALYEAHGRNATVCTDLVPNGVAVIKDCSDECTNCATRPNITQKEAHDIIGYLCRDQLGPVCKDVQPGGSHYMPNDPIRHADYLMDYYWKASFLSCSAPEKSCDYNGTARVSFCTAAVSAIELIVTAEFPATVSSNWTAAVDSLFKHIQPTDEELSYFSYVVADGTAEPVGFREGYGSLKGFKAHAQNTKAQVAEMVKLSSSFAVSATAPASVSADVAAALPSGTNEQALADFSFSRPAAVAGPTFVSLESAWKAVNATGLNDAMRSAAFVAAHVPGVLRFGAGGNGTDALVRVHAADSSALAEFLAAADGDFSAFADRAWMRAYATAGDMPDFKKAVSGVCKSGCEYYVLQRSLP